MALCHELSHVKRADLWLGLVPAAAERLFFFHPLVRLASREYLLCREAACDAAVLDTLATSPQDYGRLLLTLGVSRHRSSLAVAGASSSCSMLKRRIAMLRDSSPSTVGRRVISVVAIAAAVAAAVPLRLTARAQAPAPARADARNHRQAPAWARTDLSRIWLGPGRAWLSGGSHESLLPAEDDHEQKSRGNLYIGTGTRDLNYVLLLDDHNANMSGSLADIDRARSLRRGGERLLWIRRNGVEYVVRDATADRSGPGDLEARQRARRRARRARRQTGRARHAAGRAWRAPGRVRHAAGHPRYQARRDRRKTGDAVGARADREDRLRNAARWTTSAAGSRPRAARSKRRCGRST